MPYKTKYNYTSKERIELPITMKQINTKDEFVRMNMEVYVIDEANIEEELNHEECSTPVFKGFIS